MRHIIARIVFSRATVIIYILTVVVLMCFSPSQIGVKNPLGMGEMGDYIAHFIVFLPFMICGDTLWGNRLSVGWWFLAGSLFIIALESFQYFLPYRGFNIYDMVVGWVGLICSYLLMILFRRIRGRE